MYFSNIRADDGGQEANDAMMVDGMGRSNKQNILLLKIAMQEGSFSITHLQDLPPANPYSTVSSHHYCFRVLTADFNRNALLLYYSCFMWLATGLSTAILILCHQLHLQPFPFFITLAAALLPLNALAIYKKDIFGKNIVVSSVLLNLVIIVLAVLFSFGLRYTAVAFGAYLMIETISSCWLMQNRGKILLKVLMLIQFLIILLKMDETITLEWNQAVFGLVIIFLFLTVVAVAVLTYSVLISFGCFRESFHEIKKAGLRFLAFNLLSMASLMSIPVWAIFLGDAYHIPSMAAVIFSFLTTLFSFYNRTDISLFLCNNLEIVSKEEPQLKLTSINTNGMSHLFQVSGNWFVDKYDPETCESDLVPEECVACMDNKADAVWQPCGHCTLCEACMKQLLSNQASTCPLCKAQPSRIAVINHKSPLSSSILRHNEFEVASCISLSHR